MARWLYTTLFTLVLIFANVSVATQYFLRITDNSGKAILRNPSGDKSQPADSVLCSNFAWSAVTPIDASTGQISGKFRPSVLTINRSVDMNTALLLQSQATNSVYGGLTLTAMTGI
ncbi:hypothetical protein BP6252_13067 [Coleophoma cylindrospora]|uniref:Uncharacterized protein n=1 Tax=Coleophoma cylindrospora TaxID=1849047 RepID=A0A3D8Q9Y8_9HELO|nr:hypothetical protein BP6252_13067 [Coleophoma cylindrospora]